MWHKIVRYRLLVEHLPSSVLLGCYCWWLHDNPVLLVVAIIAGWAIDVDHVFDYALWLLRNGKKALIVDFMRGHYFQDSGKIYIPLHSWEISILLLVSSHYSSDNAVSILVFVSGIAHAAHLIQDHIAHKPTLSGYFFLARMIKSFDQSWFCNIISNEFPKR